MQPSDSPVPARLDEETIERFRRTGIRLDREGRLWHEGREVTHRGLRRALLSWLDVREDGRPILRLDERRYAYIDVEDAHLLVRSARWEGDRVFLVLNDGSEQELDYATVRVADTGAMYCKVRGGRLDARFTTAAQSALAPGIEETRGGYALRAAGGLFPIRAESREPRADAPPGASGP